MNSSWVIPLDSSIPSELAVAVRRRVGIRELPGFVARAIAHELDRAQLAALFAERLTTPRSIGR